MELKALKKEVSTVKKSGSDKNKTDKKKKSQKRRQTTSGFIANKLNISSKKDEKKGVLKKDNEKEFQVEESEHESASTFRRAIALITDYMIITLFFAPLLYLQLVDSTLLVQPSQTIMYSALLSIVGIIYASVFLIIYQQTFGMMLAKIHVPQSDKTSEKIGLIKYSMLYSGFFVFWIISIINPLLTILVWTIIFAELISYRFLEKRTIFELFGNVRLLQERR